MTWEASKAHSRVTAQRLLLSPPHVVYNELAAYGTWLLSNEWSCDEHLEQTLAARGDKLITLGLAQFGGSPKTVGDIFARVSDDVSDADFRRAVRLAILGNLNASGALRAWHDSDSETLRKVVFLGDVDESRALFTNPRHRGLLVKLYTRTGVFADVSDEEWPRLVGFTYANPGLNLDESNEHGPDLTSWGVHKALWKLVQEAPATPEWLQVLHLVLQSLVGGVARTPDNLDDVRAALIRWDGIKVAGFREGQEREGFFTSLPMAQEFRCMVAALYGRALVDHKFVIVGGPDDADQVMRCAHYGTAPMTPEQIEVARDKDGQVFTLAAVFNTSLYWKLDSRAELERGLDVSLGRKYEATCKALARQHRMFRAEPVSAEFVKEQRAPDAPEPLALDADAKALAAQVAGLKIQIASFSRWAFWGFVAVAAIAFIR